MLHVPRRELERRKFKEISQSSYGITYRSRGSVAMEDAVMDLHVGTILSKNSSALEVACPPPGIGANF
jgi:hypothetical protein